MSRFAQTDLDGNELNVRENEMEDWMNLLNLTNNDIELLRSKLKVYPMPKGGKINNDIDLSLLQDMFNKRYTQEKTDYRNTDSEAETVKPFMKLFETKPYANIGYSIHVDDIDGDKEDDLLIGAPGKII